VALAIGVGSRVGSDVGVDVAPADGGVVGSALLPSPLADGDTVDDAHATLTTTITATATAVRALRVFTPAF
jgi:hypothetical protein